MSGFASVMEHALIDNVLKGNSASDGRDKFGWGFATLSIFLFCLGSGFLIYAAYLWLQSNYSPEMASLLTGTVSLLLAAIFVTAASIAQSYRRFRLKKMRQEIGATLHAALEMLEDELSDPVRNNPKTAVLMASVAGFLTGEALN
jgi:hypothetical protein